MARGSVAMRHLQIFLLRCSSIASCAHPVQTLLFWRTKEAIKARRFMQCIDRDADLSGLYDTAKSVVDVEKTFVLDGQQRLQTLYALFHGTVLGPQEGALEAHVDVTQGGRDLEGTDLLYQLEFSAEPMALPYYRLRNLMERDAQRDAASIAYDLNDALAGTIVETTEERRARERQVHTNISQLTLLREEQHFWVAEGSAGLCPELLADFRIPKPPGCSQGAQRAVFCAV